MRTLKHKLTSLIAVILSMFVIAPFAIGDMRGIDVSGWQTPTVTCTADYDFAVVKVSQGIGYQSPSWTTQANCVLQRGLSLGLYHYAGGNNASAEADYFISAASSYVGKAVLVLDWESYQNAAWGNGAWVREFVNRVHARTGVWPIVYVQASAINQIPSDVRQNCGLWVAQYASMAATTYQAQPWNYALYGEAMRQYSGNGYVNGYSGPLDLNYFRGDADAWRKYANPSGNSAASPSTPTPSNPSQAELEDLATRTIRGDFGNNPQRQQLLGSNYDAVMAIVNARLAGSAAGTPSTTRIRTVSAGESLWSIFGADWHRIAQLNGLANPNLIYPGQQLRY